MNACRYNATNSFQALTWEQPGGGKSCGPRLTTLGAILPMTPAATPISATAKQQQQNNNDKNQVHSKSPVRYRLQMEATGRGELSSAARLEFHYWLSSLTAAFAEGRIAERPTLIAKAGTDAMRDHRTTGRSRWPPGTERRRSRRSANDGSAGGRAQLVPTMGALLVGPLDINTEQG